MGISSQDDVMQTVSQSELPIHAWWQATYRQRTDWSRWGMACSIFLHGLVALAILLGLPHLMTPLPQIFEALPIDIISQGAPGAAAALPGKPAQPEEKSSEIKIADPPIPDPLSEIAPQKKPVPPDTTTLPLRSKTNRPPRSQVKPPPQPQSGQSATGLAVTDGNGGLGLRTTQSVKDFLRAQIERHLEFDVRTLGSVNVVVSVHVLLEPDGSVRTADIVSDPRYTTDPLFHSAADSVRRAVLVASPMQLPPGRYDAFHDLVLDINPSDVTQ